MFSHESESARCIETKRLLKDAGGYVVQYKSGSGPGIVSFRMHISVAL